mmetsp:Transcript_13730/g.24019  ORF Transcript_13730/g.24019 Transcript_13730/m.24019 type:complete len:126 (-) Transcript_13730:228-605(-)
MPMNQPQGGMPMNQQVAQLQYQNMLMQQQMMLNQQQMQAAMMGQPGGMQGNMMSGMQMPVQNMPGGQFAPAMVPLGQQRKVIPNEQEINQGGTGFGFMADDQGRKSSTDAADDAFGSVFKDALKN